MRFKRMLIPIISFSILLGSCRDTQILRLLAATHFDTAANAPGPTQTAVPKSPAPKSPNVVPLPVDLTVMPEPHYSMSIEWEIPQSEFGPGDPTTPLWNY